jgi:hypothetical protein
MLSSLLVVVMQAQLPQSIPRWAQADVRSSWAEKVPISNERKSLQKMRFEVDVIDEKEVRALYDDAFKAWRARRSNETSFRLLSLFAYFPNLTSSRFSRVELSAIEACLKFPGESTSIEYAFVATCAYLENSTGKLDLDLLVLFKARAADDPLLAPLSYRLPDSHIGLLPAHKDSVPTIEKFAKRFPLRDEYWTALLMAANWNLWMRSGQGDAYRPTAIKYAKAVLAHPQSGKDSKKTAEMLLKEMGR